MATSYGIPFTTRPEIKGTFGVAASTHWLATAVAMRTLERGGNAFDAAVACAFTLQVVEPHLNGPGGEVPLILWSAKERRARVLCGQGTAPAKASIAAVPRARPQARSRAPACCRPRVPGAFDAWMQLLRDYGTLPLREVLEPAMHYASARLPAGAAHLPGDRRGGEAVPRALAELRRGLFAGPEAGLAFHEQETRSRPMSACSAKPRQRCRPRAADREGARRLVSRLRRRGDPPLLPPGGHGLHGAAQSRAPDRRRHGALAGDLRGTARPRLPELHGPQVRRVEPGPGPAAAARARRASGPGVAGSAGRRVRAPRRREREAVLRRPRCLAWRSELRRRAGDRAPFAELCEGARGPYFPPRERGVQARRSGWTKAKAARVRGGIGAPRENRARGARHRRADLRAARGRATRATST